MNATRLIALAGLLPLLAGCGFPHASSSTSTYADAKGRYLSALERDIRAAGFPTARLVPIHPAIEPYKPGAAFRKGSARPASHACIVSEHHMPETRKVRELWVSGPQPTFILEGELPDMVKAGARDVAAVANAVTLKQAAMVSLADTIQLSLTTNDLIPALRNEACLDALVATDVLMVQGIIYGADAVSSSRYLNVGASQRTLQNNQYRVMYDAAGGFYLQETKIRPQYWIVTEWRLELKVEKEPATPEQRTQALQAFVSSKAGNLVINQRTPSDLEVRAFLETLRTVAEKKRLR